MEDKPVMNMMQQWRNDLKAKENKSPADEAMIVAYNLKLIELGVETEEEQNGQE